MTKKEKKQVMETANAWHRVRRTPVVDDDFPEMMQRFELELDRLVRLAE